MTIGDRLKVERLRLGMNQPDFAAVAGTTKKSQITYEKGVMPDAAYLAAIAAVGADVLYIVTGQRSFTPPPALKPDEAALLDNYRHSPKEAKDALKATSAALAKYCSDKRTA